MDSSFLLALLSPAAMLVLGLLIGSFLNVVIHRMPRMIEREWLGDIADVLQEPSTLERALGDKTMQLGAVAEVGQQLSEALGQLPPLTLSKPRSRCPACGHQITWFENIPIFSWLLLLRGKCSACKAPISVRYPLIEALTGLLFGAVAWHFGPTAATAVYGLATALLIAGALIDLDTTWLPDNLTLPLIALGVIAAWQRWIPVSLADASLGAVFGYLSLWSVSFVYKVVRGRVGMAEGDFKLLAGLGALLGWQALVPIILMSSMVGAAVGIFLIAFKNHAREVPIPFGPYLAGGGMVVLLTGAPTIMRWLGA